MARNVPSGTTAATAVQAAAPLPPAKPATAALPAASKPAAPAAPRTAAPAAPSADEAEKASRRTSFEAESKAAQEELGAIRPYLEAVGRIAEMRRTAPLPSPLGPSGVSPNPKQRSEPLPPVVPAMTSIIGMRPGPSDLDVPARAAMKAAEIDSAFKAARADYAAAQQDIQRKEADPNFPRSQFPELAKAQRERLQRVAELAAARREYGLTD